jgi:RimJ/RimL family protein N-acetyltransferase
MPDNSPSLQLIEKLSFLYEGVANSFARISGNWCDLKHYALINPNDLSDSRLEKEFPPMDK